MLTFPTIFCDTTMGKLIMVYARTELCIKIRNLCCAVKMSSVDVTSTKKYDEVTSTTPSDKVITTPRDKVPTTLKYDEMNSKELTSKWIKF